MVTLHAQIIKKNGKKEYVVLPYDEYVLIQEAIDDYEDLRCLREAKAIEKDAPNTSLSAIKRKLRNRASKTCRRKTTV